MVSQEVHQTICQDFTYINFLTQPIIIIKTCICLRFIENKLLTYLLTYLLLSLLSIVFKMLIFFDFTGELDDVLKQKDNQVTFTESNLVFYIIQYLSAKNIS